MESARTESKVFAVPQFRYPVPDTPPDEPELWVTAFNKGWLPIVIDLVDNLLHADLFESPPDDIEEQAGQLVKQLMTPYECEVTVSEVKRSFMLHQDSIVLNGNPIALTVNASQWLNGGWRQNTEAINDEWTNGFFAPAGLYTLRIVALKSNASGILRIFVDDILMGVEDLYNGSNVFNHIIDVPLDLETDGYHIIRGKLEAKNASSSSYRCLITCFSVIPDTAD